MKILYTALICVLCSLNNVATNKNLFSVHNDKKQDFESYISKFDIFDKPYMDKDFFQERKERIGEMYTEINKLDFSSFIPYVDECNCEKDEFYYRPCYRIDKDDFYIVSILASCDLPATDGYPFDTNLLVTYDRSGNVIDYKAVAIGSDVEQYKIESGEKENELTITQQSFTEIISVSGIYTGKCNVSIYKIRINDDGTIRKETICEYEDNLPIEL